MKEGGGVREFCYNIDDEITLQILKEKASKFSFPGVWSSGGNAFGARELILMSLRTAMEKRNFQEYSQADLMSI